MQEGVLLFVSTNRVDAGLLTRMLSPVGIRVDHASSLHQATDRLGRENVTVILTEAHLPDGKWTDVLNRVQQLPHPPVVLVTHRLADHALWAEVLNLGAYDLIAQPFDRGEVQRIVANACLHAAPRKSVSAQALAAGRALAHGAY